MMRKFSLMLPIFICIAFGAVACASLPGDSQQSVARDENPCLQLSLEVERRDQQPRETHFALKLINICDYSLSLFLGGDPAYDVQVALPDGERVWSFLYDMGVLDVLRQQELKAGQTHVYSVVWEQVDNEGVAVEAGTYSAEGMLNIVTSDDSILTLRTDSIIFSTDPSP